jgi:hypothetical protein
MAHPYLANQNAANNPRGRGGVIALQRPQDSYPHAAQREYQAFHGITISGVMESIHARGSRLLLCKLHDAQAMRRFVKTCAPPLASGMKWSTWNVPEHSLPQ